MKLRQLIPQMICMTLIGSSAIAGTDPIAIFDSSNGRQLTLSQSARPEARAQLPNIRTPEFESLMPFDSLRENRSDANVIMNYKRSIAIVNLCSRYFPATFTFLESKLKSDVQMDLAAIETEVEATSSKKELADALFFCLNYHDSIAFSHPNLSDKHKQNVQKLRQVLWIAVNELSERYRTQNYKDTAKQTLRSVLSAAHIWY